MALLVKIGADLIDFDKSMKRMTKSTEAIAKKFKAVGKGLTLGLTAPIIAMGTAAIKTAADFDVSMSKVAAISGATGEDLETLRQLAKDLGASTKFSATEAADGMNYLAMAGWGVGDIMGAMPGLLNLAAASGEELGTTADIVSDAMTAMGIGAEGAGHFADVLAMAASKSNTNVSMLGESFKYAAPLAGTMGWSLEDLTMQLGLMANAGIKGSQAGTTFKSAMAAMLAPTYKQSTAMAELGLSMTNTDGSMKSLGDITAMLRDKFATLDEAQQAQYAATIFGKEAMSGMLAVINASESDFTSLVGNLGNAEGAAATMAATMQDNLGGSFTKLKSALEGIAIQIGEILMPTITKIVAVFASWVDAFAQLDPGTKEMIVKIAALAAVIGPLIIVVGSIISAFGKIQAVLAILGPAMGGIVTALGPIGIAIAAVVVAGVLLYKNWDEVSAWAQKLWTNIASAWDGIVSAVSGAVGAVSDAIFGTLAGAFDGVSAIVSSAVDNVLAFIPRFADAGKDMVAGIIQGIKDMASGPIDAIANVGNSIIGKFKDIFGIASPSKIMAELGGYIGEGLSEGIEDSAGTIANSWKAIGADLVRQANDWAGTVQSVIGTMKGAFADTMTGIGEVIVSGGSSWDTFAKFGLNALADVLKAIGAQLLAMAALKLVQWDWAGAAIAGAGAAAAFVASGVISSTAASYDVGGIIKEDQLANIHKDETIIPRGFNADMKSSGLMIKPVGLSEDDGQPISRGMFAQLARGISAFMGDEGEPAYAGGNGGSTINATINVTSPATAMRELKVLQQQLAGRR